MRLASSVLLLAGLSALASALPYCWVSNHNDKIYVENVCVNTEYYTSLDYVCLQRKDAPKQSVNVTNNLQFSFPHPVPNIDVAILDLCTPPMRPFFSSLTCTPVLLSTPCRVTIT